jgi:predicted ATP-dependent endonuclease of OLD family
MKLELRSVRIKNCGPIDDIKIDFFDASGKTLPVCVIGGANGSGKTTVLEAISAMFEFLGYSRSSNFLKSCFVEKSDFYIQVDLNLTDLQINEMSLVAGKAPSDARLLSSCFEIYQWNAARGSNDSVNELYKEINQKQSAADNGRLPGTGIFPTVLFFPHNRSLESVTSTQIHKEDLGYHFFYHLQTVRQFPGSLTSYLIWLEYSDTERFQQMQKFLNNLDFGGKTFHVNRKALDVFVRTESGHEHRLHELSSGEQNLLIILIELYRKLLPGSVVLIDEIENSLHPAYQHRLAQGLLALQKEFPYQLIVTTHAPAFVEIFGEENLRLLTPF